MASRTSKQYYFLLTAICCLGVLPLQVYLSYYDEIGQFEVPIARAFNTLCFFTNQTNFLIGIVSLLLFLNPNRDSFAFNVARLTGLVCIVVVALVYWTMIAPEYLLGLNVYTNYFIHAINPFLYVAGWLFFGPRGRTSWRVIRYSLIFPIVWVIFAFIRGAIIRWYPYNFMDVRDLGYAMALINIAVITIIFLLLYTGAHYLDRALTRKPITPSAAT